MTALASTPAKRIVRAIADAAERWTDADFPPRVRATASIAERTRYSVPVVEFALDRLFESITAAALTSAITDELGSVEILDGFLERGGRTAAHAAPVGKVCIISSRTTIGVALPAALFALCAKCGVFVKDREDALIASFFESLCEENSAFEGAAQAEAWNSRDDEIRDLRAFDAIVAFGRAETLEAIRSAAAPEARFIAFGPRASAGYVAREALRDSEAATAIARGAARDIVLYETEGCLSLHLLFVEDGGRVSANEFAALLEREIEKAAIEFPPGYDSAEMAAAAHSRALASFRAASAVAAPPAFAPRATKPLIVSGPREALQYIKQHALPLEGFAIAGDRDDLLQLATASGAVRMTRFGELQEPPLHGNHGGRPRIGEFVRWIDKTL